MTTQHRVHTLSNTSATLVGPRPVHSGGDITIQNLSDTSFVYIGGESVSSTSFGYRLDPETAWSVELNGSDTIYAIAENDGAQVAILLVGLE